MLKTIIMKNFLSFKEETVLNFEKSNYQFLEDRNTFEQITKGSFFIGANASGKTNGIKSIKILLDMLFSHSYSNIDNMVCFFSEENNIELKYEFIFDGLLIRYEITRNIDSNTFIEQLFLDSVLILDRIGSSAKYKTEKQSDYDTFEDIDSDSLFLREVYFSTKFREYPTLQKWFEFMKNTIYIDARGSKISKYSNLKLILNESLDEVGTNDINEVLNALTGDFQVEYSKECIGKKTMYVNDEKSIFIRRKRIDEPMIFEMESEGTINLLNLLPSFIHVTKNNGMLIIDEFSSAFHNFLERVLVKFFYTNSKESQLFLVTHATNLLSSELLRPDQVFSFNFKDNAGTKVIKVSEYAKPRTSQNFEKMYLSGMFEGIPHYE